MNLAEDVDRAGSLSRVTTSYQLEGRLAKKAFPQLASQPRLHHGPRKVSDSDGPVSCSLLLSKTDSWAIIE